MDSKQDNKQQPVREDPVVWHPYTCVGSPYEYLKYASKPVSDFRPYTGNPPWAGKKKGKKNRKR